MRRGKLIVFEGIDGAGKTTQVRMLFDLLHKSGADVHQFREPGGTEVGEKVRGVLLARREIETDLDPVAEFLLFAAARRELVRNKLRPLLDGGATVLLDRFGDSSVAYQGYGRGVDVEFIRGINRYVTEGLDPDRGILLDLDPAIARARVGAGTDRLESGGEPFFRRVREGYLEIARGDPERYRVIDAARPPEEVFRDVVRALEGV